jgi:hypothetical protein
MCQRHCLSSIGLQHREQFQSKQQKYLGVKLNIVKTTIIAALISVCLIYTWGCTPKFEIYVDGYPAPQELNMAWSPDRSVALTWFFSRWYLKKLENEGFSEFVEYPQHLSFEALNKLPSDTTNVVINLQIYNPHRRKYRLVKIVKSEKKSRDEHFGKWTIRERNSVSANGPLTPDREISISVQLISNGKKGEDEQIISTGELRYIIRSAIPSHPVEKKGGDFTVKGGYDPQD